MNKLKKVSIVIPVYNAEKYIKRCIQSVVHQKYDNLEIIVINDGSTDNTLSILKELQLMNSNLRVFSIVNSGVSSARNYGIDHASGEFLCFIDADDYVSADYIVKMIEAWEPQSAILCNFNWVRNDAISVNKIENTNYEKKDIIKLFLNTLLSQPWNKLYETRIIKQKVLRFRKEISIAEDFFFNLEYYKNFQKFIVVSPEYNYVINSCGLNVSQRKQKDFIDIFSKQCFDLMCVGLENKADQRDIYLLDHHYISLMWQNAKENRGLLMTNSYYQTVRKSIKKQDILFKVAEGLYICGYDKYGELLLKICRIFGKRRKKYTILIEERKLAVDSMQGMRE